MAELSDFYTNTGLRLLEADASLLALSRQLHTAIHNAAVDRSQRARLQLQGQAAAEEKALPLHTQLWRWVWREADAAVELPDPQDEIERNERADRVAGLAAWHDDNRGSLREVAKEAKEAGASELAEHLVLQMAVVFHLMHATRWSNSELSYGDDLTLMHRGFPPPPIQLEPSERADLAMHELLGAGPRRNYQGSFRYNLKRAAIILDRRGTDIPFDVVREVLEWHATTFSGLRNQYWRIAERVRDNPRAADADVRLSKTRARHMDTAANVADALHSGAPVDALEIDPDSLQAWALLADVARDQYSAQADQFVADIETIAQAIQASSTDTHLNAWATRVTQGDQVQVLVLH